MFALGTPLLVISLIYHIVIVLWVIRNRKVRPKFVGSLVALYLLSYMALSVQGEYVRANHGGAHYTRSWCPRFVIVEYRVVRVHIRPTALVAIYLPLVVLDRLFVHPATEPWDGYYDYLDDARSRAGA